MLKFLRWLWGGEPTKKRLSVRRLNNGEHYDCSICYSKQPAGYELRVLGLGTLHLCRGCLIVLEIEITNARWRK